MAVGGRAHERLNNWDVNVSRSREGGVPSSSILYICFIFHEMPSDEYQSLCDNSSLTRHYVSSHTRSMKFHGWTYANSNIICKGMVTKESMHVLLRNYPRSLRYYIILKTHFESSHISVCINLDASCAIREKSLVDPCTHSIKRYSRKSIKILTYR